MNHQQQEELLSEIYSLIISIEYTEKAYYSDTINQQLYSKTINKLLAQYKTTTNLYPNFDLSSFCTTYNLNPIAASKRIEIGIVYNKEHNSNLNIV